MEGEPVSMARPFPQPCSMLAMMLVELQVAADCEPGRDKELARRESEQVATLDRPWDPASCAPDVRSEIYKWLDEVVDWINEQHTWRVDRTIPVCWIEHPHIVHELATLACLRWEAGYAARPGPLAIWQQQTLPTFLGLISQRIGPTGCPPGRHQPSPGAARHALYRSDAQARARRRREASG